MFFVVGGRFYRCIFPTLIYHYFSVNSLNYIIKPDQCSLLLVPTHLSVEHTTRHHVDCISTSVNMHQKAFVPFQPAIQISSSYDTKCMMHCQRILPITILVAFPCMPTCIKHFIPFQLAIHINSSYVTKNINATSEEKADLIWIHLHVH